MLRKRRIALSQLWEELKFSTVEVIKNRYCHFVYELGGAELRRAPSSSVSSDSAESALKSTRSVSILPTQSIYRFGKRCVISRDLKTQVANRKRIETGKSHGVKFIMRHVPIIGTGAIIFRVDKSELSAECSTSASSVLISFLFFAFRLYGCRILRRIRTM